MNVLAPFGFYGWGNIGDESTLQGFSRLVARSNRPLRVWIGSRDPAHTARVEPSFRYFRAGSTDLRVRWARLRAKAHVVAGGTPIMDNLGEWPLSELVPLVRASVQSNRPFVCVGVGVETLRQEASRQLFAAELARTVVHWSVRGARDQARLVELGVPPDRITSAADMAWLLDPVDRTFGQRRLSALTNTFDGRLRIGVNLNLEHGMIQQRPELTLVVAKALDRLVDALNATVVFLCNEVREGKTFDKAAAQAVMAHMHGRDRAFMVPNEYFTPQEMLSLIACCDVTFSSRYHFCLFSAMQGVPFVALNRSDKVDDLCLDLNVQSVSIADLDADGLCERIVSLLEHRNRASELLAARVAGLRSRAEANIAALNALAA